MSFNGLLNTTCTIQTLTETQDADTGQDIKTWTDTEINVKCRLDNAEGDEIMSDTGEVVKASHTLFLNNPTYINLDEKSNRIVIEGISYNILLVKDAGGHGHHTELLLRRIH
jgi:SPP1 family predicted phage head-tail adaptor